MKVLLPRQLLEERELWAAQTREALAAGSQAVVRLSARMPAALRICGLADGPVGCGSAAFEAECHRLGLSLQHLGPGRGALGPWVLWSSHNDPVLLKQLALLVEEGSLLGQLLDVDVYSQNGPVSRPMLGLPPRSCVICGQPAAVCTGRSIHSMSTVESAFLALLESSATIIPNSVAAQSRTRLQDFLQPSFRFSTGSPDGYAVGVQPPLNIREIQPKGGDTP
jgi:holo-ACP synthase CitX